MREITGTLRGLLKKSNRPPQGRKNRVIFDETKNEFFEADYIILIREDCGYSEEDEEPCSCNNHELVRICCEEGCQCSYSEDNKLPQSPKYTPPMGFVDEAALSPPDGYKDNGLKNSLVNALGGHVFGAQHIQQLQVIQRLQQQRAAMLAAKATQNKDPPTPDKSAQNVVCTECAECAECSTQIGPSIELVANSIEGDPNQLTTVALLPLHHNSPERRMTQKEIIAGEERPKYVKEETIVKENHDVQEDETIKAKIVTETAYTIEDPIQVEKRDISNLNKNGILKGGKLWKQEDNQVEEITTVNTNAGDIETLSKRSVRFSSDNEEEASDDKNNELANTQDSENILTELIPLKKHSSIFNNALRPNSAVRQLFPSVARPASALTHEALRAFDESKRSRTLISDLLTGHIETDSIRKSERNTLRRSLLRKKIIKSDTSLEERIKLLTCDIEEAPEEIVSDNNERQNNFNEYVREEFKKKSIGDDNIKPIVEKNFSPASSASSSSSSSSQIYKKSLDKQNNDVKQDKNPEGIVNPIVIIPQVQDCRCPAAPDLGIGVHVPVVHTQIHQTPLRQAEIKKQFLSTLAPLTSCVAGQKDDLSYYTLAANEKNYALAADESSTNDPENHKLLYVGDNFKVAPDVIAGTPGQEREINDLQGIIQQTNNKTEKSKQKSVRESVSVNSDDDEQNDYGFNKRPSVRGIKTKFDSSNKILQEMQDKINETLEIDNSFKFYKTQRNKKAEDINQCSKIISTMPGENEQNWNYNENDKSQDEINQIPHYYGSSNLTLQPTFHSHQESLVYQNCHSVTTEKHISRYARSPSRRPESPPPLRNYHQTMVLIPFNAETCSQLSTTSSTGEHHIQRQNILEYQQVTQQTIRVPIGYAFPTMQLHVLTGRKQVNQLAPYPRFINQRSLDLSNSPHNFDDCRIAEGATAVVNQCRNVISETSKSTEHNNNNNNNNNNQAVTAATSDTVYYAMNV